MSRPPLRIGLVLPDVLGTYGDDGNALVLRQRARMRDIPAEIVRITLGMEVPDDLGVYTIGGGEDTAQILAAEHLSTDGGLTRAAEAGRPMLAICAGLQVLGRSFRAAGREVSGVGIIDAATAPMAGRAIGELASTPSAAARELGLTEPLTGFENHLGATIVGPDAAPLGKVNRGTGNADQHAAEVGKGSSEQAQLGVDGVVQGSVVATYMHGPCLARNPQLADLLLARALGIAPAELEPLEIPEIDRLRMERLAQ